MSQKNALKECGSRDHEEWSRISGGKVNVESNVFLDTHLSISIPMSISMCSCSEDRKSKAPFAKTQHSVWTKRAHSVSESG
jgi:hypothetical protein